MAEVGINRRLLSGEKPITAGTVEQLRHETEPVAVVNERWLQKLREFLSLVGSQNKLAKMLGVFRPYLGRVVSEQDSENVVGAFLWGWSIWHVIPRLWLRPKRLVEEIVANRRLPYSSRDSARDAEAIEIVVLPAALSQWQRKISDRQNIPAQPAPPSQSVDA